MKERRKRRRFVIESYLEAILHVDESQTRGDVIDLNTIGAFVATDLVLDKGEELRVELVIPDVEPLLIQAVVARRTERIVGPSGVIPSGLGLMFVTVNDEEATFLQNAVIVALERALERAKAHAV